MDLWEHNPVTCNFLISLKLEIESLQDALNQNQFIDSSNNDLSMNLTHSAMGSIKGLETAINFRGLLNKCGMVEKKEDGSNDKSIRSGY